MERNSGCSEDNPLQLTAMIEETILDRPIGGDNASVVMGGQLRHLVDLAERDMSRFWSCRPPSGATTVWRAGSTYCTSSTRRATSRRSRLATSRSPTIRLTFKISIRWRSAL
ncbi:Scr1 family TA system antitoxin-like transcriptional regulator [Actinophytocola gossypii]|uniref:Scr1 family TA system antitoxin-like transcriptional regulator n=1 Tax=Actinophytocola gossypii TaxID=2812003 RepID=UPI004057594A